MGLTTSLYTALTGLNANSMAISVAGNNIANANTTAFKSTRADFDTQILQSFGSGTSPTSDRGGTNPVQVGLGTRLAGTTRNMNNGTIQLTGVATDLAIEGNAFFVLDLAGATRYTRDGSFTIDTEQKLVNSSGGRVQGYSIDGEFNIVDGVLTDISVPVGTLTLAQATSEVRFGGNLNAGGDVASQGTLIRSQTLYSDAGAATPAVAADALTSLRNAAGAQLFQDGDVITITRASKGGSNVPDHKFQVGAANTTRSDDFGTTLQDLMDFLQDIFGIDTDVSGGVTVQNGQLQIEGNAGSINDLALEADNFILNQATAAALPIQFDKVNSADGESVRTTFLAYDSLGTELTLDLSVVLESVGNGGSTWRFYAQSTDDSDLSRVLGNGTLSFDTSGRFLSATGTTITLDRNNTGSLTPQTINLKFNLPEQSMSALADDSSSVAAIAQNGNPIGTLESFNVSEDGTINGSFSNGLLRSLGRIVLAKFVNADGLNESAGNLFAETAASGSAAIVRPGQGGAGRIIGQALELSNVDLSQEFISLITATTGFTANSRVFTTSDRLVQELLSSLR